MRAMESSRTDPPVAPAGGDHAHEAGEQADLEAIATVQGCDRTDLTGLVGHLRASGVTPRQLPGVLREACARLGRLRRDSPPDSRTAQPAGAAAAALAQARRALQPGPAFSLEAADQAFADALSLLGQIAATSPDLAASVQAQRAAVAALRQQHRRAAELYAQAAATPGLAPAAQWRYQRERAAALEERGREYADDDALQEAVALYREAVSPLAPRSERPGDWSATQHALGNALGLLGQRGRGTRMLEQAVAALEDALQERSPECSPLEWAATQHAIGNALGILGQREADDERLKAAIAAFERALEVRSREQTPDEWAMTQSHLATALLTLGRLTRDSAVLAGAIDAYRQALMVWSPKQSPMDWARTQNSLGMALRVRGEQGGDPRELTEAVVAYRAALGVWTRERAPDEWGMTQNNLGAALQRLAEREDDAGLLREAIGAYENALEGLQRSETPIAWAMTTANLGDARRGLAERARDLEAARLAVADFEAVAAVFHDASHAQYYELAKERLAVARKLVAELSL